MLEFPTISDYGKTAGKKMRAPSGSGKSRWPVQTGVNKLIQSWATFICGLQKACETLHTGGTA